MTRNLVIVLLMVHTLPLALEAQYTDSTGKMIPAYGVVTLPDHWEVRPAKQPFPVNSFIVPAAMIAYGVTSLNNHKLKDWNAELKEEIWDEKPHKQIHIDNYLQFAPAAAVYGLNAMGIHGKHNFKDRTILYGMSTLIMSGTVFAVKKYAAYERPDGSNKLSFPSGHTANAFMSAEFLRQEYKDVSPWYGVAGYAVAAATGYLRMYNNKHWFGDVVAGAGIGIASTKMAYWLYPKMQHWISPNKDLHTVVMPTYQNGAVGLGLVHSFR